MHSIQLALTSLEEITRAFLLGESGLVFRDLMSAIVRASESGASQHEIRQALVQAQTQTEGKQQPQAAARLTELLAR